MLRQSHARLKMPLCDLVSASRDHFEFPPAAAAQPSWPDAQLVRECLGGNEGAWSALIDKYKNLIYSVPVRWGFSQSDASDIFQSVVAELLSHLSGLRDPNAISGWLIQTTSHKCNRWRQEQLRESAAEDSEVIAETTAEPSPQWTSAKPTINHSAHTTNRASRERGP